MTGVDEALLVLDDAATLPMVESAAPVRQRYGDRVAIVSAEVASSLRHIPGLRIYVAKSGPGEPPPDASESERIGVEAWNARLSFGDKRRKGEGLDWDTPGFEAP